MWRTTAGCWCGLVAGSSSNPTEMTFAINGQPMKIYSRRVRNGESLTLGS